VNITSRKYSTMFEYAVTSLVYFDSIISLSHQMLQADQGCYNDYERMNALCPYDVQTHQHQLRTYGRSEPV
jgi:hypothetical protein